MQPGLMNIGEDTQLQPTVVVVVSLVVLVVGGAVKSNMPVGL